MSNFVPASGLVRREGILWGKAPYGERLKMVRTTDSPWNNTPQKPHTFEDLQLMYASAVVIEGAARVFNGNG